MLVEQLKNGRNTLFDKIFLYGAILSNNEFTNLNIYTKKTYDHSVLSLNPKVKLSMLI